jgi:hypothetical protein
MTIRTVRSFRELEQFGIKALTGEACGYSLRILCDVTERGKSLVEKYFGGTLQIERGSNMNGDGENVGSIMFTYDVVVSLGVFCLLYTSLDPDALVCTIEGSHGDLSAIEYSGEALASLRKLWEREDDEVIRPGHIVYRNSDKPGESRLILVGTVSRDVDEVIITGDDGRETRCPRSEIEILESSLFEERFQRYTGCTIKRIYKRSAHPGSKDRNLHAFSGRIQ